MTIVIIGKKVPKGLKEINGSMHLGNGIWAFKCEIDENHKIKGKKKSCKCYDEGTKGGWAYLCPNCGYPLRFYIKKGMKRSRCINCKLEIKYEEE